VSLFKDIVVSLKPWVVFTNARYQFGRELDISGLEEWIRDAFWWQSPEIVWSIATTSDSVTIEVPKTWLSIRLRPVIASFGDDRFCLIDGYVVEDRMFRFRLPQGKQLERIANLEEPEMRLRFVEDQHAMVIPELMARLPKISEAEPGHPY